MNDQRPEKNSKDEILLSVDINDLKVELASAVKIVFNINVFKLPEYLKPSKWLENINLESKFTEILTNIEYFTIYDSKRLNEVLNQGVVPVVPYVIKYKNSIVSNVVFTHYEDFESNYLEMMKQFGEEHIKNVMLSQVQEYVNFLLKAILREEYIDFLKSELKTQVLSKD